MRRALGLLPLLVVSACSGPGNTGRPEPDVELWSQIPWANYGTPQFYEKPDGGMGGPKISGAPIYPPIGDNQMDPGSQKIDCSVLDDIELSPYWVETFEPYAPGVTVDGQPYWGVATAWASYDDGSDGSFRTPGDVGWYPDLGGGMYFDEGHPEGGLTPYGRSARATWGMPADRHPAAVENVHTGVRPECDGSPNEFALHYRGGRFNFYGGGFSHQFSPPMDAGLVVPDDGEWILKEACPPPDPSQDPALSLCSQDPDIFAPRGKEVFEASRPGYWDASGYDGLAFWARRGPDGTPSLLVGLHDKHTSMDLNRESEQYCKVFKECEPRCTNGFSCIDDGQGTERCMPEGYSIPPASSLNVALKEFLFPPCGGSTCTPPSFNPDPDFNNTTCESVPGQTVGNYCIGPDRPLPPAVERCGDTFMRQIVLSTDWQLYKLPFDTFRQSGQGKPAPYFDLETLNLIVFEASVGDVDVFVDNVSFYRNK